MQFQVAFKNSVNLTYDLVDHEIAHIWANKITRRTIIDCCKINHYTGYYSPDLLQANIARLYEVADIINDSVPNRIEKIEFTKENYHSALNKMHIHFPDLEFKEEYKHLTRYLSEYNDLIHWLEPNLIDYYNDIRDNRKFSIKLDFNKADPIETNSDIPESAYNLFNGYFSFGQLMLHYVHVGRHAWELFFANDFDCPKYQFVPQYQFNASVRMHFFDNILDNKNNRDFFDKRWNFYYKLRGGKEFFEYDITDPSIRFGYCQIGNLSNITYNNVELKLPTTLEEISYIRNKIVETSIEDWQIKGA